MWQTHRHNDGIYRALHSVVHEKYERFDGRPKAQSPPPSLNLKKNYTIGTSLLDTRWDYGNDHAHHVATHTDWLSRYIWVVSQHAIWASSLTYQGLYEYAQMAWYLIVVLGNTAILDYSEISRYSRYLVMI